MSVLIKDMKDYDCLCFISLEILCLLIFVTLVKIKSHDQFMQITGKLKMVHLLFLATVYVYILYTHILNVFVFLILVLIIFFDSFVLFH